MTSQLNYLLARDHVAELTRQAKRVRQARGGDTAEAGSRPGRFLMLGRSEQRELALAPCGVECAPIAGPCL
jgi:hypothetical protein